MRTRERLAAFWSGEQPDRIPFTTYENKIPPDWSDPVIRQMLADGLGVLRFIPTWSARYDGDVNGSSSSVGKADERFASRYAARQPARYPLSGRMIGSKNIFWKLLKITG